MLHPTKDAAKPPKAADAFDAVDVGDTPLACTRRGAGEPLVLVHGSNSDLRTWLPVLPGLGRAYRVCAYSRRHHWPNAPIAAGQDYAMAGQIDDLEAIVDRLQAAPARLIGHSYGALLCLQLALRTPQRVRSLVLVEPPALTLFTSARPTPPQLLRLLAKRPRLALAIVRLGAFGMAPAEAALRRGDSEAALQRVGSAVLGARAYRMLSPERLAQARANMIGAELLGSGMLPIDAARLRQLACPTLLLCGANSPRLFHHLSAALAQWLPRARQAVVPAASHLVHEDNPQGWLDAVLDFLAERPPPALSR